MRLTLAVLLTAALAGCGESARLPDKADMGARPTLTEPRRGRDHRARRVGAGPAQPDAVGLRDRGVLLRALHRPDGTDGPAAAGRHHHLRPRPAGVRADARLHGDPCRREQHRQPGHRRAAAVAQRAVGFRLGAVLGLALGHRRRVDRRAPADRAAKPVPPSPEPASDPALPRGRPLCPTPVAASAAAGAGQAAAPQPIHLTQAGHAVCPGEPQEHFSANRGRVAAPETWWSVHDPSRRLRSGRACR
ncbi:hypothetical protein OSTOST_11936 [Ostertagia ostertagi]